MNIFKLLKSSKPYSKFINKMDAQDLIESTRDYLDYVEKHLKNVADAFAELSDACDGKMHWVGDDCAWFTLRREVEMHDLSKLSAMELTQYRDYFYPVEGKEKDESSFKGACDHHIKNNHHHHQSVRNYSDIVHMVIDWVAMSYEFGGCPYDYYISNKSKMKFTDNQHDYVEEIFKHLLDYRKAA